MRDNSKRTGAAVEPVLQQTSTMEFATPTELVDLPSQGKFYPVDHPLHGEEAIEIKFMTARDEDILTSPSLLKKGVAVDRFIQNVIVDKSIKVETLLSGDKAAIMISSRINGYGSEYRTKMQCPECEKPSEASFDLSDVGYYYGDDYEEFDISPTGRGTFIIKTPVTKIDVEVRLMTSRDESVLVNNFKKNSAKKDSENTQFTDQLRMLISSVKGDSSRLVINSFIAHLPAFDSRYIRAAYSRLVPGPDMTQNFGCPACGFEKEVDIPMTVDFFWSNK
jgi:hypothetical protein